MKRGGPLKRKTPLRSSGFASYPPERGTGQRPPIRRFKRLAPISAKQREKKAVRAAQVAAEGERFHQAIVGQRCIVCGRTDAQAREETGLGHQAHHGIRKEVLKRLGLAHVLWSVGNALCVCEEPCHRQHTTRKQRIRRAYLPPYFFDWCIRHGLALEIEKEYPTP